MICWCFDSGLHDRGPEGQFLRGQQVSIGTLGGAVWRCWIDTSADQPPPPPPPRRRVVDYLIRARIGPSWAGLRMCFGGNLGLRGARIRDGPGTGMVDIITYQSSSVLILDLERESPSNV